jgi:glycopeptide antibiotics resistance protein
VDLNPVNLDQAIPLFLIGLALVTVGGVMLLNARLNAGRVYSRALLATGLDAAIAVSVLAIAVVTLVPGPGLGTEAPVLKLVPFQDLWEVFTDSPESPGALQNLQSNVLLFIPFGVFLALRLKSTKRVILVFIAGVLLSGCIETAQLLFPGRTIATDDVIFNGVGALLGAILAVPVVRIRQW